MGRKLFLCCVLLLLMAAAADPLAGTAGGDSLASPTPRPTQRVTAPAISGVNLGIVPPEGEQGDFNPSGGYPLQDSSLFFAGSLPTYVEVQPLAEERPPILGVGDLSSGPAALTLAMDLLRGGDPRKGPTANQVQDFLVDQGLSYDWGTGVEELTLAARSFGFPAAQAFHHGNLDELTAYLRSGRPLVVPLGVNGSGQPGHFVVLTGTSAGGGLINCRDPHSGVFQLSREDFLSLWELQGRTGLVFDEFPLAASAEFPLPWMGLLSALSTLAVVLNRSGGLGLADYCRRVRRKLAHPQRKASGGGSQTGAGIDKKLPARDEIALAWDSSAPRLPAAEGEWVQTGLRGVKCVVPVYETRRLQVGFQKETRQVPVYKKVKVICGTRLVRKKVPVTRYRVKKSWAWKKVTQQVPSTRWKGSKRLVVGYQNHTRWERVPVKQRVPYQAYRAIQVKEPIYRLREVQCGTRPVTRWVPRYQSKQVLVGTKTMVRTIPIYERIKTPDGSPKDKQQIHGNQAPDTGKGGPGISGKEQRLRELLLKVPPPEEEISSLIRKGIGPVWPPLEEKNLTESWLVKAFLFIRRCKEGIARVVERLGGPHSPPSPPHLFSYSAYQGVPLDRITEDGILLNSYLPPHYLDLFYTQHDLDIGTKVKFTAYPDGLMNLNLTQKSWSLKIGNTTLFTNLSGEFGFAKKVGQMDSNFDQVISKHSFIFHAGGISYKSKIEGIVIDLRRSDEQIEIQEIRSLSCKITTIRTLGIIVGVLAAVLITALLLLYFASGVPFPAPI